jgi:hypothetical protein
MKGIEEDKSQGQGLILVDITEAAIEKIAEIRDLITVMDIKKIVVTSLGTTIVEVTAIKEEDSAIEMTNEENHIKENLSKFSERKNYKSLLS